MSEWTLYMVVTSLWLLRYCLATHGEAMILHDPVVQEINDIDMDTTGIIQETKTKTRRIYIEGDNFKKDGKTFYIHSGSMHYFRVPSQYWRDRLKKIKAIGMNSVSSYVEWSFHEPEERQYRFTGDYDVAAFIKMAAEEGLYVLLRPGPYICAERDLGGMPYWLFSKYPHIKLRTSDKNFIAETTIWFHKVFEQLKPLLYGNGGPVILVQVENEYGSYGKNKTYMGKIRDLLKAQVGDNALLYTTDGASRGYLEDGRIDGALTTIDFGADAGMNGSLAILREVMPSGPLMNSELYDGWLTRWTDRPGTISTKGVVGALRYFLSNPVNFNFYMLVGGTNFEFTAGVINSKPQVTSYDYDAPINEAGDPTEKYFAIRNVSIEFDPSVGKIPVPKPSPKGKYGRVSLRASLQMLSPAGVKALGRHYPGVHSYILPTFEALRQRAGFVLYETFINVNRSSILYIKKPGDLVLVYVDGVKQGNNTRFQKLLNLTISGTQKSKLSLLVESQGHTNYGNIHDFKGILSPVVLAGHRLSGPWKVTGFPLEAMDHRVDAAGDITPAAGDVSHGPVLYEGTFVLPQGEAPKDTFINTKGWYKGIIWVNGHNLGRYWCVGPQLTLYVPGVWLLPAPAKNQLRVLEISQQPQRLYMDLIDYPVLNATQSCY